MTSTSKPLRVIVIDDSAPFRRHVGGALEASGLIVAEASEGYEALWRVRAEGVFDLILLDIHMPNLDGLMFIREVRKLPEYVEVPIFVLTSDGSRERREEGRLAGATAWLLKPPDLSALVHSVHAALLQLIKVKDPNPAAAKSLAALTGPVSARRASPARATTPARPSRPARASRPSRPPSSSRAPVSRAALSSRAPASSRAPLAPRAIASPPAPAPGPTRPSSLVPGQRPLAAGRLAPVPDPSRRPKDPGEGSND